MEDNGRPHWARLGQEIARYRDLAGLSQEQLAEVTGWSRSQISALHNGTRTPKREQVAALDDALSAGGALMQLWTNLVKHANTPHFFRDIAALERETSAIREYHPQLVPGLLQTKSYAEAVIRTGRPWFSQQEVDRLVNGRIERQAILTRSDPPITWFVIDHAVLRRPLGGPAVLREQLERLLKLKGSAHLQVIRDDVGDYPGLGGAFRIMHFAERPIMVYAEHALGGELSDASRHVETLSAVFSAVQAEALSPSASAALIRQTLEEIP